MSSYFDDKYGGEGDDDNDNISVTSSTSSSQKYEDEIDDEVIEDNDEPEVFEEGDDEDEEEIDEDEEDEELEGGAPDDMEIDEESEKKAKRTKKVPAKTVYKKPILEDEDDQEEDDDGELYLQKFDNSINDNYIVNFHPECALQNYDEILSMIVVVRDKNGIIVDDLHKTIPYLTKYERARILGQRAKQINSGSPPFVKVPENVIDGYIIAELELKEKKIPFIIRRPLPNGGSEYWSIKDLEDILF
jgi:DNA-directed RNA polymerase I, II, and III subunit RPABC2